MSMQHRHLSIKCRLTQYAVCLSPTGDGAAEIQTLVDISQSTEKIVEVNTLKISKYSILLRGGYYSVSINMLRC